MNEENKQLRNLSQHFIQEEQKWLETIFIKNQRMLQKNLENEIAELTKMNHDQKSKLLERDVENKELREKLETFETFKECKNLQGHQ